MNVLIYTADQGGCMFYRCAEPARVASGDGVSVELNRDMDVHFWITDYVVDPAYSEDRPVSATFSADTPGPALEAADVVVFQRPVQPMCPELARFCREDLGKAVVVELDDDLESVDRRSLVYPGTVGHDVPSEETGLSHHVRYVRETLEHAHVLTASTPAIAERYRPPSGEAVVIRNGVAAAEFVPAEKPASGPLSLLWTGNVTTHVGDLERTDGGVAAALAGTAVEVVISGQTRGTHQSERVGADYIRHLLQLRPWTRVTQLEWVTGVEGYLAQLRDLARTRQLIGIAPLQSSKFNDAKSALKPTEYSALGIPFVCSDSPEYVAYATRVFGREGAKRVIARKPRDWTRLLRDFIADADLRERVGKQAQARAAETETGEARAEEWLAAWRRAVELAKEGP